MGAYLVHSFSDGVVGGDEVTMNEGNNLLQIEEHMYILDDIA